MITLKATRRLRLREEEGDTLLAGIDFHLHYLGCEEVLITDYDLDDIVKSIYAKYTTNDDINSSTLISITVGTNQVEFFNLSNSELELRIETPDIKSIHCGGTRPKKYPNAVVLVVCERHSPPKLHVLHCHDAKKAKKIFETISRVFKHNDTEKTRSQSVKEKHANSKLSTNNGKNQIACDITYEQQAAKTTGDVLAETRPKLRSKSALQSRGAEALVLLENADPDETFDEQEFTKFARDRSASDTFKLFGR